MGYAYAATLGQGETFTTVELKINFLRAVRWCLAGWGSSAEGRTR